MSHPLITINHHKSSINHPSTSIKKSPCPPALSTWGSPHRDLHGGRCTSPPFACYVGPVPPVASRISSGDGGDSSPWGTSWVIYHGGFFLFFFPRESSGFFCLCFFCFFLPMVFFGDENPHGKYHLVTLSTENIPHCLMVFVAGKLVKRVAQPRIHHRID